MRSKYFAAISLVAALYANVPAFAATTAVTFDSLVASGFEVKTMTELSDSAIKQVWPGQTLGPQVLITLQKGNSVAVCNFPTQNWLGLLDVSLTSADRCVTR